MSALHADASHRPLVQVKPVPAQHGTDEEQLLPTVFVQEPAATQSAPLHVFEQQVESLTQIELSAAHSTIGSSHVPPVVGHTSVPQQVTDDPHGSPAVLHVDVPHPAEAIPTTIADNNKLPIFRVIVPSACSL